MHNRQTTMNKLLHFPVLRVVLPDETDWNELEWYGFKTDRTCEAIGKNVLADLPSTEKLEILLPARRVSAHRLLLPAQAGKHLDALIEQALEDRLIGDKADALAIHGHSSGSERCIWVCSRGWLESGLERLVAAGFHPTFLLPEYDLLPVDTEAIVYATTSYGLLFHALDGQYGVVPDEATLRQLIADAPLRPIADLRRLPPVANDIPLPKSLARFSTSSFELRQLYRPSAMLAILALLLMLNALIHWQRLEHRETNLQHEIRQTFATIFPGTPIIDPILQWESKQREVSQTQADALDSVISFAAHVDAPIRPSRIEAGDGYIRLVLTDSEVAQFRKQLEAVGKLETSPAEPGLTRLNFQQNLPPR